jgi:hypothetical protein
LRADEVLAAVDEFEFVHEIRDADERDAILATLPAEPSEYVAAVEEVFGDLTLERYWDQVETYQRFEDALRELFYADYRSAEALLWIVRWAASAPDFHEFGMNALAAFANMLKDPLPRNLETVLIPLLQECLSIEPLRHNAAACLRSIADRNGR